MILAVETYRHRSIGTILRCASAFGATCIIVIGSPLYSTHGAHGAQNHIDVIHFYYWHECLSYCRERNCTVYAISPKIVAPHDSGPSRKFSASVDRFHFNNDCDACFIVGEREGLTDEQVEISDVVLHVDIPNVLYEEKIAYDSKVAICLHSYAVCAGVVPRSHENEKHVLGTVDFRRAKTIKVGRNNARKAECDTNDAVEDIEDGLSALFA